MFEDEQDIEIVSKYHPTAKVLLLFYFYLFSFEIRSYCVDEPGLELTG